MSAKLTKLEQQAAEVIESDQGMAFDYRAQNKAARSYVHSVRKLAGKVESTRKELTASLLERKRAIDARAKEIASPLREVIDRHAKQIEAVEEEDRRRQQQIDDDIEQLVEAGKTMNGLRRKPLSELLSQQAWLKGQNLTEDRFEGALEEAENVVAMGLQGLAQAIEHAREEEEERRRIEAERAELKRLRQEAEQREAKQAKQHPEALPATAPSQDEVPPLDLEVQEDLDPEGVFEDRGPSDVLGIVVDDLTEVWDNAMSESETGDFNTMGFIENVARRLIAGEAPSIQIVVEETAE